MLPNTEEKTSTETSSSSGSGTAAMKHRQWRRTSPTRNLPRIRVQLRSAGMLKTSVEQWIQEFERISHALEWDEK